MHWFGRMHAGWSQILSEVSAAQAATLTPLQGVPEVHPTYGETV